MRSQQLPSLLFSWTLLASLGIAQEPIRCVQSTNFADNQLLTEVSKKLNEPSPVRGMKKPVPLKELMSMYTIAIWVDEKALEEESVPVGEPILLPDIPRISIKNQLNLVLEPLNLTYVEMPGYLVVTSKKSSANVIRLYDVTSLVSCSKGIERGYNYSPLIAIIEQTINPAEWLCAGGCSSMIDWRTSTAAILVVSAPSETHDAIRDLLDAQRELLMQAASRRPPRAMQFSARSGTTVRRSDLGRGSISRKAIASVFR